MSTKFLIGCDPEFFLSDPAARAFIPAHGIVPGDKKNPYKLPDGSHVQVDGMAVEFNIEPAESGKEFQDKVDSALNEIRKIVPNKLEFKFRPVVTFSKRLFDKCPPETKELGCDPDYHANILSPIQNRVPADIGYKRTGSGHIHLGWTSGEDTSFMSSHFIDCLAVINEFDVFYTRYKQVYDYLYNTRERYYGGPLAFRAKAYGVEYRTPSNVWLSYKNHGKFLADSFLAIAKAAENGDYVSSKIRNCDYSILRNAALKRLGLPSLE